MKYQIKNETVNKIVLTDESTDVELCAGQYISALFLVGIVKHCVNDIEWTGDNTFRIKSNNWKFSVTEVA